MRFTFVFFVCLMTACSYVDAGNDTPPTATHAVTPEIQELPMSADDIPIKENVLTVTGTIVYKNLEGGFYGFDAQNGRKYLPHGLPLEFRKNGLVVELRGTIEKEMMSFKQYGEILKVKSVKVIDDSNVKQQDYY